MKIILNLTKAQQLFPNSFQNYAEGMLPILDKPLVAYFIDELSQQGFKEIYILVNNETKEITRQLGYGEYWSLAINYLDLDSQNGLFQAEKLKQQHIQEKIIGLKVTNKISNSEQDKIDSNEEKSLYHLQSLDILSKPQCYQFLSYEIQPNMYLSEGAKYHTTSDFPAHIGRYSYIEPCIYRGPAIIGENSTVGKGTILDNTVIMPNTRIGENLDLSNCLVTADWVYHQVTNSCIDINSHELLSAA